MAKPITVTIPARLWVSENASGIMVSTNMARMPPAATARVTAVTSTGK